MPGKAARDLRIATDGGKVIPSAGRANWHLAEIIRFPNKRAGIDAVPDASVFFHRPGRHGAVQLPQIGQARFGLAQGSGLNQTGNGDGQQKANDRDHEQDFDERKGRKPGLFCSHDVSANFL